MKLRIFHFIPSTIAEGPGRRACLWLQGCSIRCPGCFNPHTWDPMGGEEVDVDELARRLLRANDIEGVTFLGGEPFDQAIAVAELAGHARRGGLSVMTFTGYERERLATGERPGWTQLLSATDLLVDGPFLRERPDHRRPWVGSTNQRFHFITPRYRALAEVLDAVPDRVELRLGTDGTVWLNGQCPAPTLVQLKRIIRQGDA